MSLKAKLEAVIYAAEEPVTLNQLAALFAADALEWKAAKEAAAAEQTAEVAGVSPDEAQTLPLIVQAQESPAFGETSASAETRVSAETRADGEPAPVPDAEETRPTAAPAEGPVAGPEADRPQTNEVVSIGEAEAYPFITVEGESPAAAAPAAEAAPTLADPESEARRLARQRDREVKAVLKQLLDELIAGYEADGSGVEIREIAGGYRMATKPECHDAVRLFVKSLKPPLKLSLPALETLAVIAYKQPVTAPEVSEIRGVESAGVLGSLLARKLIATAGRKPVIGRPILYKTTKEFLLRFGLKDVSELPSMEEFEKMAATELEMEPEVVEADKAAEDAEAIAETQGAELDTERNLESNSPTGDLAETAEAVDKPERLVKQESGGENVDAFVEHPDAVNARTDEPMHNESVPAQSNPEQQTEATSHAQKSEQESRKEG
jgi:segregation and condensation protein B